MSSPDHYNTISIGSGEGGKYICFDRASHGERIAIIEHKWYGGSCPNMACLPSKTLLYAADVLHSAQKYASTGVFKAAGGIAVDMSGSRDRKRGVVDGLIQMHKDVFKATGIDMILGHARLLDPKTIEVELKEGGKRTLTADRIILCTGSRAAIGDTPGLKEANPLTHIELLELDEVPKHLIILGGGYSGLEFAQGFRRFGAEVTVIERNNKVLKNEDEDVSSLLVDILKDEGVTFCTSTSISNVSGTSGQSVTLSSTHDGQPFDITGSHLVVTAGRIPNTEDTGLEAAGVELAPSGHIKVNEHLQTTVPNIFAVGDCAGSPYFTHMGLDDFRVVRDFINKKEKPHTTKGRLVPYTLYTSPELSHVGLSEDEARAAGIKYRLAKVPMAGYLRTRTMDATRGFAKALVSAIDDTILGFTALGPRAGELLPVVTLAMTAGLPYTSIAELIIPHPTVSEGLIMTFSEVPAK